MYTFKSVSQNNYERLGLPEFVRIRTDNGSVDICMLYCSVACCKTNKDIILIASSGSKNKIIYNNSISILNVYKNKLYIVMKPEIEYSLSQCKVSQGPYQ